MKTRSWILWGGLLLTPFVLHATAFAAEPIDLASALRLAGAQNLDVQLAMEESTEARAHHGAALMAFYPWLAASVGYRGHSGLAQNTDGTIVDADKNLVTYGPALIAQVDLGDAIYKNLASKQLVRAADAAGEAQRRDSIMLAAFAYFDLVQAQAAEGIAADAVEVTQDFTKQLGNAVEIGLALRGDALRAQVQADKAVLVRQQTGAARRLAATRLATHLHLDPAVELAARDADLAPLDLFPAGTASLAALIGQAKARPELAHSQALVDAALAQRNAAKYGALIPSVGGYAGIGGLFGGRDGDSSRDGDTSDYGIALTWRIGPGGLFDRTRTDAAESRLRQAQIQQAKTADAIAGQAIEAYTRVRSLGEQFGTAAQALATSQESLRIAEQRKEFGIAAVLDRLTAQQDLVQARLAHSTALTEYNKAQYLLRRAAGFDAP